MIASTTAVNSGFEERHEAFVEPFLGDREDTLNGGGVFGVFHRGVAEQRTDRCEACVTGPRVVVAFSLDVGKKPVDQCDVEIGDVEIGGMFPGGRLSETE